MPGNLGLEGGVWKIFIGRVRVGAGWLARAYLTRRRGGAEIFNFFEKGELQC